MTPPVVQMAMAPCMTTRRHRFEKLLPEILPGLRRYANYLCRGCGSPEDLVQETLLRAWQALDALREDAVAHSWLMTILRREFMREWAKHKPMVDIEMLEIADTGTSEPDSDMRDIGLALEKLGPKYSEPLALQIAGFNTREIARTLGLTQSAALTRLFRARSLLCALLKRPATRTQSCTHKHHQEIYQEAWIQQRSATPEYAEAGGVAWQGISG